MLRRKAINEVVQARPLGVDIRLSTDFHLGFGLSAGSDQEQLRALFYLGASRARLSDQACEHGTLHPEPTGNFIHLVFKQQKPFKQPIRNCLDHLPV